MGNIKAKPFANVDLYQCMILKHATRSRSYAMCNLFDSLDDKVSFCKQMANELSVFQKAIVVQLKMEIEKGRDKQREIMISRLVGFLDDLQKTADWIGEGINTYCAKQLEILQHEMTALETEIQQTLTGLDTRNRKDRNNQAQAFEKRLLVKAKNHRAITSGRNYVCRKTNRTLKY